MLQAATVTAVAYLSGYARTEREDAVSVNVKTIRMSDVAACPKHSLLPAHFHADGSCRCADLDDAKAAVAAVDRDIAELDRLRADAVARRAAAVEWRRSC